jgi:hypothetical protein
MAQTAPTIAGPRAARLRRGRSAGEFDRQGYMIVPDLLDPALLAAARAETVAICRGERGEVDGVMPPGAGDDAEAVLRRYLTAA